VITTPVPTVALLAAARAMTQPEPPADLGLHRAVRESLLPPERSADSEPPPSSERRAAYSSSQGRAREGQLLESEAFEFELTPRSVRNSQAAPPLAEELGLDHLIADFKPARSWSLWLRSYGVWVVAALLVLWLVISFAASWLPG
jgi:hypothetical protein